MSIPCQFAARSCFHFVGCSARPLRSPLTRVYPSAQHLSTGRRWQSTEAGTSNTKVSDIVAQISQLTLLETADLVAGLKLRLNIPAMPMGGFAAGPAAVASAPVEEEEVVPEKVEKTLFNLKLASFTAAGKPKVIREMKAMFGMSLVDSKKFVESAPKMMRENVPKVEAEKIVATLQALGAVVEME